MSFGIGTLAKRSGVKIETIRYYERIGLIPSPPRTDGRRRKYADTDIKRLGFIRRGREIGFSLEEIRHLFKLSEKGKSCGEVKKITVEHAKTIKNKIRDLRKLQKLLEETAAKCEGGTAPDCPILETLASID